MYHVIGFSINEVLKGAHFPLINLITKLHHQNVDYIITDPHNHDNLTNKHFELLGLTTESISNDLKSHLGDYANYYLLNDFAFELIEKHFQTMRVLGVLNLNEIPNNHSKIISLTFYHQII